MFNFQKEVVINSLDEAAVKVIDSLQVKGKELAGQSTKKLRVRDGGEYFGKYVVDAKAYRTKAVDGSMVKIELVPDKIKSLVGGSHVQIAIELGLDNEYRGDFGSALWYFRRPVVVDLDLAKLTADKMKDAYNAVLAIEDKPLEVSVVAATESAPAKVVLQGTDSAVKVRKIELIGFKCDVRCEGQSEEPVVVAELHKAGATEGGEVTVTANKLEFGTYNYLLHNLRLPTYENMRFMSPSAMEAPIKGHKYDQFSFAYCVPRVGLGGMSAVGQTIHSTTLHTFYVDQTIADTFEGELAKIGVTVETMDENPDAHDPSVVTILPDGLASKADLAEEIKKVNETIEEKHK